MIANATPTMDDIAAVAQPDGSLTFKGVRYTSPSLTQFAGQRGIWTAKHGTRLQFSFDGHRVDVEQAPADKERWHLDFLRAVEAGYSPSLARMAALGSAVLRGETRRPETAHSDKRPLRKSAARQRTSKCIHTRGTGVVMPKDFPTTGEFVRHLKEQLGPQAFQALISKNKAVAA